MTPTIFQPAEIRDSNDNIIRQGAYGKNSPLANATNDAWIDYVMNNLEFLYDLAKDEVVPVSVLPSSGDMNKTYLLTTTGVCYRWDGTAWVEISSSEAVGRAEAAADLAEEWATKTNGTVDGSEYSAKYYANAAQQSADDAQDTADDMATHLAQIDQNTGGVSANSKRISNIEKLLQGHLYDYQTDSTSAYTKSVPSGAMPYAGLEKVGGKTVVWNQLVNQTDFSDSNANCSWVYTASNFTLTVTVPDTTSGNSVISSSSINTVIGHKYIFTDYENSGSVANYVSDYSNSTNYNSAIFTATGAVARIRTRVSAGTVAGTYTVIWQLIDLTLMFGAGNEPSTVEEFEAMFPASYYPYNAGTLLSAGVTSVVSRRNINNQALSRFDSATIKTSNLPIVPRNTYVLSVDDSDIDVLIYRVYYYKQDGSYLSYNTVNKKNVTVTSPNNAYFIMMYIKKVDGEAIIGDKVPINAKVLSLINTYPIPTAIRNIEGYGWSCPDHYNYIDYEAKKYVQEVGSRAYASGDESDSTVITDGTTTYYPLNPAIENDISAYLTDDNLIEVEAGGTLTFPNQNGTDYQIPVPSEGTYMVDLQEAINNG